MSVRVVAYYDTWDEARVAWLARLTAIEAASPRRAAREVINHLDARMDTPNALPYVNDVLAALDPATHKASTLRAALLVTECVAGHLLPARAVLLARYVAAYGPEVV